MKTADLAFAATLSAMLMASLAAIGSLGLRTGPADGAMPMFRLEPVVITGTKGAAPVAGIKKAQLEDATSTCPPEPQLAQKRV
jgi:hypothetical protein